MVLLSHHIYCEFRLFLGSLEPFLIDFLEIANTYYSSINCLWLMASAACSLSLKFSKLSSPISARSIEKDMPNCTTSLPILLLFVVSLQYYRKACVGIPRYGLEYIIEEQFSHILSQRFGVRN